MTDWLRHLVVAHEPQIAWHLLGADPARHRVVAAQVPPNLRNRHELGQEILAGLGKRADVSGVGRHAQMDWDVLPAWFDAHQVTDLVLLGVELLPEGLLYDLGVLSADAGCVLWAVAWGPVDDDYLETIAAHPHQPADLDDVMALVPATPSGGIAVAEAWFPTVPGTSYLMFLATCRDLLPADDFAIVKARYLDAAGTMRTWFDAAPTIDEAAVHQQLRLLLRPCVSYDEMITVLRAAQAMAHVAGWAIQVDPMRLTATAATAPAATIADARTWRRLTAYRDPYRPAACALAAAEFSVDDIRALRLGDVADDGTTATPSGEAPTAVPEGAALFLRAQVAYRRRQGATDTDLLFAELDRPLSDRTIVEAVRAPATELGINLLSGSFQRRRVDDRAWTHRWGISVQDVR